MSAKSKRIARILGSGREIPIADRVDITKLTENSGDATPDSTIADVSTATTGTDGTTPGAASLKTDVDARLVAIDSNFADLAAKVNEIYDILESLGLPTK